MNEFLHYLAELRKKNLYRYRLDREDQWINFSDNDYLGLRKNKLISEAIKQSIDQYGNGSGASHLISGHFVSHSRVEEKIAGILGFEKSLFFHSGYIANAAFFKNFLKKGDDVFLDKLCHASIYDGVLSVDANLIRYPHLNYQYLEKKLKTSKASKKIIVTDSVFSMDGDCALLKDLIALSSQYNAYLFIDDAHGFGVYGDHGLGLMEEQNCLNFNKSRIIHLTTFGKAAGISGAALCGPEHIIEFIKQKSREYIYTTATPPYIADGVLTAIDLIIHGNHLRDQLKQNIVYFRGLIRNQDYLSNVHGPIQPIMINNNLKVISYQEALKAIGIHVAAVRAPTVPLNSSRLRITIRADHTQQDIRLLANQLNYTLENEH
ncbi:MAG: aminotransferase class I/II-fold pyridoxal phosphate-dependent enzyme [Methylophilaceae bacterium]